MNPVQCIFASATIDIATFIKKCFCSKQIRELPLIKTEMKLLKFDFDISDFMILISNPYFQQKSKKNYADLPL